MEHRSEAAWGGFAVARSEPGTVQAAARVKPGQFVRAGWLIMMTVLMGACGTKGPPKPPLSRAPEPVQNLFARQSGASIEVRWSRPSRRTDGAPIEGPLAYELLVRVKDGSQAAAPAPPREPDGGIAGSGAGERWAEGRAESESFLKTAVVVERLAEPGATLPRARAPIIEVAGNGPIQALLAPQTLLERLSSLEGDSRQIDRRPLANLGSRSSGSPLTGVRLALAVVARDAHGRRSRPGAIVEIDPVPPLPLLESLTAKGAPKGIELSWNRPGGESPTGVNVYRRLASSDPTQGFPTKPIPGSPFAGEEALDATAELGEAYHYEGRVVSTAPGKGLRESLPLVASLEFTDRFAPGPPSLLTAEVDTDGGAAKPTPIVRLRWSSPIDSDVAGYRIYRADGDRDPTIRDQVTAPLTLWEDAQVVPGVQYHYTVTAIDGADPPNESERSDVVDVEVPAAGTQGPESE